MEYFGGQAGANPCLDAELGLAVDVLLYFELLTEF
jgi:hypothetical protein